MAEWFECVIILSTRQTPVEWQHGQIYRQGMNWQNFVDKDIDNKRPTKKIIVTGEKRY